jgi:CelD/BcsL family acetyltransferase involved in cellulose biosynthesis
MTWQFFPASQFASHASAWDGLQSTSTNTPFLESGFIAPLLHEFGTGGELLALHRSAGALDAATIVQPIGKGMWQTFQPSQLPLGPWVSHHANDDLDARLRSLVSALPGLALGMGVTQLDPRLQTPPPASARLELLHYINTSFIDIAGTFDAYWEARGKNLRQNTRKQRNKLAADGIRAQLQCITEPAQVAQALVDYGRLESAGWKAGTGTAIAPDNAQGRFYQKMLHNFCAQGRGRIYRYSFNDQVVAMDLCIDNGPLVVVLKTAYDESLRTVSPSTLMRQDQFAQWWAEGRFQRIEFYGKTMEWHTRWTDQERALYHATAFRWSILRTVRERLAGLKSTPGPVTASAPATTTDKAA